MAAELDIDVRISDELRALMAARRPVRAPEARPDPVAPPAPLWPVRHLRQDGARPLSFRGNLIWERRQVVEGAVTLGLALHLVETGGLALALSAEPDAGQAGRPRHRAGFVQGPEDLGPALSDFRPQACLEPLYLTDPAARDRLHALQVAIGTAFTSMAAECLAEGILPA